VILHPIFVVEISSHININHVVVIKELGFRPAPFWLFNSVMWILKLILTYTIAALCCIIGVIARIIRLLASGLLEMHLFLEWCMFQLVKLVETIYPDE